jgi:hypothetical protein
MKNFIETQFKLEEKLAYLKTHILTLDIFFKNKSELNHRHILFVYDFPKIELASHKINEPLDRWIN